MNNIINTFEFIKSILIDSILPIIAIIISLYTLKKQNTTEKKISAPCFIIDKEEIILENKWNFTNDIKFNKKSINVLSCVLSRGRKHELFTTLILNFANHEISLSDVNDNEVKDFFNHAIIHIRNIGNPLIKININKIDVLFDDTTKNFSLAPQDAYYYGFIDNNESLSFIVTFLFDKKDNYFDCTSIPKSDMDKIRKCKNNNCLNVHFSKVTNNYQQLKFYITTTNQYNEDYTQKIILDSHNNTYTTWILR